MTAESRQARIERALAIAVVGVLPCALVALANAEFIFAHFYARTPYLLDSAWLAAVVHRSGPFLRNPSANTHYGESFYSVHVSPFMSLFSVLSYLVPLDRVAWYAIFQGVVYAPLAATVYLVSSRTGRLAGARLPLAALAGVAFAFSGQAIVAIQYPHFEVATAAFICLLLASIVTNRQKLIWPLFLLAVSVREDSGFHTACALCPLLYLSRRAEDALLRKKLFTLIAVAAGVTVAAFALQKLVFPGPPTPWRMAFFGDPLFHQLKAHPLSERLTWLLRNCPYITVPFGATVLVAAVRRDARYLLGWLAVSPWLCVNLLAYVEAKWRLSAYVGFPFFTGVFWMYLYGALLAPRERRMKGWATELVFAATCLASTGAVELQFPGMLESVARGMLRTEPAHPREVRAYASAIVAHVNLGRMCVDPPVGALAVDAIRPGAGCDPGRRDTDTFAFHRDGPFDANLLVDLAANGISRCTHVLETGYFLCSKVEAAAAGLAMVATEQVPPLLAFAGVDTAGRRISFEPDGVVIAAGSAPGLAVANRPLTTHADGNYEIVWDLDAGDAPPAPSAEEPLATVEVLVDGVVGSRARVTREGGREQRLLLPFAIRANQWFGARLWYHGPGALRIVNAQVRATPKL